MSRLLGAGAQVRISPFRGAMGLGSTRRPETSQDVVRKRCSIKVLKSNDLFLRSVGSDILGHGTTDSLCEGGARLPRESVFQPY
jgi:hypothetical protein